jgi:hypothetical protein
MDVLSSDIEERKKEVIIIKSHIIISNKEGCEKQGWSAE